MAEDELSRIAHGYRRFAREDVAVSSPLYAELAAGVAARTAPRSSSTPRS